MKIMTYNVYGVVDTNDNIPRFEVRLENLKNYLKEILMGQKPDIICLQEVNMHNLTHIEAVMKEYGYESGEYYYLKNPSLANQINPIFYKKEMKLLKEYCVGHASEYTKNTEEQELSMGISDFRGTTVNVLKNVDEKIYIVGNTHTDYISSEAKREGIRKSILEIESELDYYSEAIPILLGDMNMVPHMSEVYQILNLIPKWTTKNKESRICSQSYHGYNNNEEVNCDFAFVLKSSFPSFSHEVLMKKNKTDEPSDHRPVIFEYRTA